MAATIPRLIALQKDKLSEIKDMSNRLKEKDRASFNANIVNTRVDQLHQVWNEARATHSDIVSSTDPAVDDFLDDRVFRQIQAWYEDTSDFLMMLLTEIEQANVQEASSNVADTLSTHTSHETQATQAQPQIYPKMQKLELPKFDGTYESWQNFSELFRALVHDLPNMPDSTKLIALQSCMTGRAIQILKSMTPPRAKYREVWETLTSRFQNRRFIVYNELQNLMDIQSLPEETSADKLRYFTDEVLGTYRVLSNMEMPVDKWDVWIVFLLASRIDKESQKLWETRLNAKDVATPIADDAENPLNRFPTFKEFSDFLEERSRTLCMLSLDKRQHKKTGSSSKSNPGSKRSHHVAFGNTPGCPICKEDHYLGKCESFLKKGLSDKKKIVRNAHLCSNCFGRHNYTKCSSNARCRHCNTKHHSLICDKKYGRPLADESSTQAETKTQVHLATSVNACNSNVVNPTRVVILATAQIDIISPQGKQTRARALLDQGSEATFISEPLVKRLSLPKRRVQTVLSGVGGSKAGSVNSATYFTVRSRTNSKFQLEMDAYVLPRLTSELPVQNVVELDLARLKGPRLADPQFHISDSIDLLIGADFYGQLLRPGLEQIPDTLLTAQNTAFGWVISGPTHQQSPRRAETTNAINLLHCQTANLDELLQCFWTLEEVPTTPKLSPQDEACEKLFAETHTRDSEGRYVVRLPLKSEPPPAASETRRTALGSLHHMGRRFARDPPLEAAYRDFMEEYRRLGHMALVPPAELDNPRAWYTPHHAVVQTLPRYKVRVVFDGSRKRKKEPVEEAPPKPDCLNDYFLSGPTLLRALDLILLLWRRYQYVFTADIVKMFRQIRVALQDQDLLRIVWPPEAPRDWRLTTVTYGTNCAPYLAIRTLMQLASDGKAQYPLGADCLESNTYVDDIFAGADDLFTAIKKRDELIDLLKSAGIDLDKWAANHRDLLPTSGQGSSSAKVIDRDGPVKILGVLWNPAKDQFGFNTMLGNPTEKITKRLVLSDTARLFDPLGWLTPVTITAKVIMQDLWIFKCDWDDALPLEIRDRWIDYHSSLEALSSISLDRWLGSTEKASCEIHGFSDASSRAYAAVVYLRTIDKAGNARTSILAAKSKVAPVKTVSIPNLELCGAALLVRLVNHLRKLEFLESTPVHLWSDSQIVLTWLNKHPCHWKTFVANRVSLIQTELPSASWSHVPTKENPADLATRGVVPSDLKSSQIWWHGPHWLTLTPDHWPHRPQATRVLHLQVQDSEFKLIRQYSSLPRLIRIAAYCLRFVANYRRKREGLALSAGALKVPELNAARNALIRSVQAQAFTSEISLLKQGRPLRKGNALRKLNPILRKTDGLLCVGGRLANSLLSYERKHPPILPRDSPLSVMFIKWAHRIALHGGPTLTTNVLIQNTWILGMRPLVKTTIRRCVTCQRHKPRSAQQMMGELPAARVTPARPFTTTGVDYAGPIQVRTSKGRGPHAYKGYIALFICFATKAVHLEAVSDLTTKRFIEAFSRFTSRRGVPQKMYSDNATNFRGADTELKAMFNAASKFYEAAASTLASSGTAWSFIPANTPHYGGLWEAGVRSVKHLLKRSIGDHTLTFEELSTVLAEIEACLNSRPICPLRGHPEDLDALTPAHFLTGATSLLIPDEEPPNVPENRLDRYQLIQRMRNQFWSQWTNDYLQHLQERNKWRTPVKNYGVGQLVLVKDDRYPPSKWPLGRVIEVHPGKDDLVRVVSVKTATGTYRRHIHRLAPLLLEDQQACVHLLRRYHQLKSSAPTHM